MVEDNSQSLEESQPEAVLEKVKECLQSDSRHTAGKTLPWTTVMPLRSHSAGDLEMLLLALSLGHWDSAWNEPQGLEIAEPVISIPRYSEMPEWTAEMAKAAAVVVVADAM